VSKFKLSLMRALDSGPSLDASQKEKKRKNSNFLHSQGQLPTATSSQSIKIQALVNESFRFRPQP
jgi:hypothetical protein